MRSTTNPNLTVAHGAFSGPRAETDILLSRFVGIQTGRTMKLAHGLLDSITDKGSERTYNFVPMSRLISSLRLQWPAQQQSARHRFESVLSVTSSSSRLKMYEPAHIKKPIPGVDWNSGQTNQVEPRTVVQPDSLRSLDECLLPNQNTKIIGLILTGEVKVDLFPLLLAKGKLSLQPDDGIGTLLQIFSSDVGPNHSPVVVSVRLFIGIIDVRELSLLIFQW